MRTLVAVAALALVPGATGASSTVTIGSNVKVVNAATGTPLVLSGTISLPREDEEVEIFARVCGTGWVRWDRATTQAGGTWRLPTGVVANTKFRARWRTHRSTIVRVRARPFVELEPLGENRFLLRARAMEHFHNFRFRIERFVPGEGWRRVGAGTLRRHGSAGQFAVSEGRARAAVKPGDQVRAVVPIDPRGSCYVTAISLIVRV